MSLAKSQVAGAVMKCTRQKGLFKNYKKAVSDQPWAPAGLQWGFPGGGFAAEGVVCEGRGGEEEGSRGMPKAYLALILQGPGYYHI